MSKRTTACRWCGRRCDQTTGAGRVREFCRPSHRTAFHFWVRRSDNPVTLRELIQREGLYCGICSGPIELAGRGGLTPTIDHIIPVVCGGSNAIDNLQIAHKRCNILKGGRLDFRCPPIGHEGDAQLPFPGFPR